MQQHHATQALDVGSVLLVLLRPDVVQIGQKGRVAFKLLQIVGITPVLRKAQRLLHIGLVRQTAQNHRDEGRNQKLSTAKLATLRRGPADKVDDRKLVTALEIAASNKTALREANQVEALAETGVIINGLAEEFDLVT
eukprot:TRINITY_DN10795_c1_g2_i1.p1 TRINITY_DN10795_c1_g2~~TRINITY_DN10795_c1_g2_i1.p1  ORF type:complete len:138 (-),score=14.45 TRINITY_DN10795_c1_g2_i1:287-700(-)